MARPWRGGGLRASSNAAGCSSLGKDSSQPRPIQSASADLIFRRAVRISRAGLQGCQKIMSGESWMAIARAASISLIHSRCSELLPLPGSVMVAQQVLVLFVEVRVLAG